MSGEVFTLDAKTKNSLFESVTQRSDYIFTRVLFLSFAFGLFLATFYDTWMIAILVGGGNLLAYYGTKLLMPDSKLYQYVGASVMALFMAQFIYQMHGLFEMHFSAFVACTILITYQNWRLQVPLLILIVVHHAAFAYMQFIGIPGVYFTQLPYMDLVTFLFHAGFAAVIIVICGVWAYYGEKKIIEDGLRALRAEAQLHRNLSLAKAIKNEDFDFNPIKDQDDPLSDALLDMRTHIVATKEKEKNEKYISQGVHTVSSLLTGLSKADTKELSLKLLSTIAEYICAVQGTFFLIKEEPGEEAYLQLIAGYAFQERKSLTNKVALGEGLIGQAAFEGKPILVQNIPEDYIMINSSLGHGSPTNVIAWPMVNDNQVIGVMEFAFFEVLGKNQKNFLGEIAPRIAGALSMTEAQRKTEALLKASEELKGELLVSNTQLEESAEELRKSEMNLREQQELLLKSNTDLEERSQELEVQKVALQKQNEEIENARETLFLKAQELEAASKYKSEFLANMSHELRTPLNSILILAEMLANNKGERLNTKEVEHAQVIHRAGNDLLTLINDILDLSKIEAGRLDIITEDVSVSDLSKDMELMFEHVAIEKQVNYQINIDDNIPAYINTDRVRLGQILKNLLSNAFKFTPKDGTVSLEMCFASNDVSFKSDSLAKAQKVVRISVKDTGIGIPQEKQALIFEAFRQADGSTSRKYGGTGLGLSISLKLASLLGGEIQLTSKENQGSDFSLFIPLEQTGTGEIRNQSIKNYDFNGENILVVEDQALQSAAIVELLQSHQLCYAQAFTAEEALKLRFQEQSFDCILLDMNLPDMNGIELLSRFKEEGLVQIPVILHTALDVSPEQLAFLEEFDFKIITKAAHSGEEILKTLAVLFYEREKRVDSPGSEPTEKPKVQPKEEIPYAHTYSEERRTEILKGKRVLLAEDDMRNIFAVMAVLDNYEIEVEVANNGREAIELLGEIQVPDAMLIDIMMPELDGYETISLIREEDKFQEVPIIVITANASDEDRQKCIQTGANDFITKPINIQRLVDQMCMWISKEIPKGEA